ncbi:MAG: zinc ribbon domain-containing protein [Candidatus Lokiarchaeota archaeon]|nr:zinc ribbon domain-containing protein [Candidatus Lokiarchaeota archaeon]
MSSQISCPKCGKVNVIKNKYCIECGFRFEGNDLVEFQILENLKTSLYSSIICILIFVAFMILITVGIIAEYGLYGFISIPVIWPLTIGFLVWAKCYFKGLSTDRRFTITKDFIEIIVPLKPAFQIKWSEFDSIEITKRDSMTAIPTGSGIILGPRFVYFNLIFKGKNVDRSYEFESGKAFKVRSRKKILIALEQSSKERGKDFTRWR